jgi:hypothetical protein
MIPTSLLRSNITRKEKYIGGLGVERLILEPREPSTVVNLLRVLHI